MYNVAFSGRETLLNAGKQVVKESKNHIPVPDSAPIKNAADLNKIADTSNVPAEAYRALYVPQPVKKPEEPPVEVVDPSILY